MILLTAKKEFDRVQAKIRDAWAKVKTNGKLQKVEIDEDLKHEFMFCGYNWTISEFAYRDVVELPEVFELEEWFEKCMREQY